ncbi:MAG: OmpA family protein, partial [Lachnospiraceae bacterium]|nr:OmpA family protein [Lachnospiraceae bacterium]
ILPSVVGAEMCLIESDLGALQSAFSNSTMKVDAQTGSITFSSDVLFRYNSASLTAESRETLKNIIPMYLDVLLQDQFRDYIAEIIIEGHTDTDGGYRSNMELSYERANAVADFCLNQRNGLSEEKIEQLQKLLTVNGKSWSNPIYEKDSSGNTTKEVDMPASRRVEIKFRLKEDEMIEKITEVLEQR